MSPCGSLIQARPNFISGKMISWQIVPCLCAAISILKYSNRLDFCSAFVKIMARIGNDGIQHNSVQHENRRFLHKEYADSRESIRFIFLRTSSDLGRRFRQHFQKLSKYSQTQQMRDQTKIYFGCFFSHDIVITGVNAAIVFDFGRTRRQRRLLCRIRKWLLLHFLFYNIYRYLRFGYRTQRIIKLARIQQPSLRIKSLDFYRAHRKKTAKGSRYIERGQSFPYRFITLTLYFLVISRTYCIVLRQKLESLVFRKSLSFQLVHVLLLEQNKIPLTLLFNQSIYLQQSCLNQN